MYKYTEERWPVDFNRLILSWLKFKLYYFFYLLLCVEMGFNNWNTITKKLHIRLRFFLNNLYLSRKLILIKYFFGGINEKISIEETKKERIKKK